MKSSKTDIVYNIRVYLSHIEKLCTDLDKASITCILYSVTYVYTYSNYESVDVV